MRKGACQRIARRCKLSGTGEHRWQSAESIALLAAIAGLFHDFGKAGMCFQQTLRKSACLPAVSPR
jgi:hypothetical protein